MKRLTTTLACVLLYSVTLGAQQPASSKWEITDNSFLVEESFNQEPRIFQNIFTWTRERRGQWSASFTQEWPAPDKQHQLSFTIPFSGSDSASGINDLLVNYRYQLLDEGPGRPALSPRLSVVLPSGSTSKGLGLGAYGLQFNVPASKQFGDLYVHANAGGTWRPRVETDTTRRRVNLWSPHVAGSVIWRATPMLNLMLESILEFEQSVDVDGETPRERTVTISPGFRRGWNRGDTQIVVGVGVPVSRASGETTAALLTYFSLEMPFKK